MLDHLLESVHDDYTKYKDQEWTEDTVSPADINVLREEANKKNSWDEERLRLRLWEQWLSKSATLTAYWCEYGRVICLSPSDKPIPKPSPLWIRAFRILGGGKLVRILWFASPIKRLPPPVGEPIQPKHVNGGYTKPCKTDSIVVYRKEEALRVVLHELLHASCSDPFDDDLAFLEADTEAWAEVILVALKAKGERREFLRLWSTQASYAVRQAAAAERYYGVSSPKDYGWRYLTGRIERYKSYNLPVPLKPTVVKPLTTLRLTPEALSD